MFPVHSAYFLLCMQIVTLIFTFYVLITFESPWYDLRGWLGVKKQLSIYLLIFFKTSTLQANLQNFNTGHCFSQLLRLRRVFSDDEDFLKQADGVASLTVHLPRGYPKNTVQTPPLSPPLPPPGAVLLLPCRQVYGPSIRREQLLRGYAKGHEVSCLG